MHVNRHLFFSDRIPTTDRGQAFASVQLRELVNLLVQFVGALVADTASSLSHTHPSMSDRLGKLPPALAWNLPQTSLGCCLSRKQRHAETSKGKQNSQGDKLTVTVAVGDTPLNSRFIVT